MENPVENVTFIVALLIFIPVILGIWQGNYPLAQKISGSMSFFVPFMLIPFVSIWFLSKLLKIPTRLFSLIALGIISGFIILVGAFFISNSLVVALALAALISSVLLKYSLKTTWQKAALMGTGAAIASFVVNWLVSFIPFSQ